MSRGGRRADVDAGIGNRPGSPAVWWGSGEGKGHAYGLWRRDRAVGRRMTFPPNTPAQANAGAFLESTPSSLTSLLGSFLRPGHANCLASRWTNSTAGAPH